MAGKRRGRGEGAIEELPSGSFRAVVSLGLGPDGKRRRLAQTFLTRKSALRWKTERLAELGRGRLPDSGTVTVGEWLDRWLAHHKGKVAPKTYDHDAFRVNKFLKPKLGAVPLAKLSALAVEDLLADLEREGRSTSERFKVGVVLRAALKRAVAASLVGHNVASDVKLPKVVRPEKTALDERQAVRLLESTSGRLAAAVDLAIDSGCRPGELFALHWSDIDWQAGVAYFHRSLEEIIGKLRLKESKTPKSRRRLILAPRTLAALARHREAMIVEGQDVTGGLVFCDTRGGPLRQSNFSRRALAPALKAAGLPRIRPYDLRHTSATLLLMKGVNVKAVSERLGHESIELTLRCYAHVLPSMQQAAADTMQAMFGAVPQ